MPVRRIHACYLLFAIAVFLPGRPAVAQPAIPPGTRSHFSANPVPFEEADLAARRAKKVFATVGIGAQANSVPAEIVEMARALKNDPDLIYQYVHDHIEFSPLWGYLKGPVGTLLDGRGDSFDQAALMVALLKQASLSNPAISNVQFEFGQLNLTNAQLQGWLGVDDKSDSAKGVLGSGGIPSTVHADGTALVGEVWVSVSINGTAYVFDPAFKMHSWKPGIVANLPAILGYTQQQLFNDAAATVTASSIANVHRDAIRNDLNTYAGKLATYIRTNMPAAGVSDVIGGGTIVPAPFSNGQTLRQTSNPNQAAAPTAWQSIPSQYLATLTVRLGLNSNSPGGTFNSADLYGHRLSIFFDASFTPTLYLDGAAVATGSPAAFQGDLSFVFESIDIPWYPFADTGQLQTIFAYPGRGGYVLQTGWDQVGRGMVEKHRALLNQAIASGAAPNSELVLGETLALIGYTWLAECAAQQRLSDQLLGTTTQYLYGGGMIGESTSADTTSPFVDLPLNFIQTPARINGTPQATANSVAAAFDESGASSAFESAVLEQTQGGVAGFEAASTVKLLDFGVQSGDTIFDIGNGNVSDAQTYQNVIRPQLVPNYHDYDLNAIDSYVNGGYRVIAPLHGRIAVGAWSGFGYKVMKGPAGNTSYSELISGGLIRLGGSGGVEDPPETLTQNAGNNMPTVTVDPDVANQSLNASPGSNSSVGDPIDRQKGSFQYTHGDLAIGARAFPYGLAFTRFYDSAAQNSNGPLGAGWTHNFAIRATTASDGFAGMGQSSLLAAVNSIVATYVSSDLMKGQAAQGQANLQNFVVETIVNRWFTDQLTQNVVNVSQGWNSEQFVKIADGTYAPQLGSSAILDAPGGTFRYRNKQGATMSFDASGQISNWKNAAGATVNFTYANGQLSTVSNPDTGRQLTLSYNGNLISSVSDGTRSVSYGYTGNNLTTFTDPLQQNITYAYDTSGQQDTAGHLTKIFYPSHPDNALVTNFYDSLGRVKQQADANGNLTQAFFAGSRTELADPVGNHHVWYNDALGNPAAEIQDYGPAPHLNLTTTTTYDVQGNPVATTMPEGDVISLTYDSLYNPLTISHAPKPGSGLAPLVQTYTYTTPVASLPNFEKAATFTDPNGNLSTYTHSTTTGMLVKVEQPAVSRPGAGSSRPQQTFTYNGIGLPETVQDAEGRITRYQYDGTHGDEVVKAILDDGRLNLTTQYGYSALGDVTSTTDANGHTTTMSYDDLRRVVEIDAPVSGVSTTYSYFPDGQVKAITRGAANPESLQYSYTLSDQPSTLTDALGNVITKTYDANDRVLTIESQVTGTQVRKRTYSYDALSRLSRLSDTTAGTPGTLLEAFSYTPNGRSATVTDANNHTTSHGYDGLDRVTQTTYPDGSTRKFQLDANGNILQVTTRSGQTIGYTYDALNRTISKTPQGEAAGQVTFGYDLTGHLLRAADASSATPYSVGYDTAGRPISFTDQQGRNTSVAYDAMGNRTRLQWPAGTNGNGAYFVTYQYDPMNRMVEIDENGSPASPLAKYQWDSLSRLTLISYGDGTSDSYAQYDAGDNLQTLVENFNGFRVTFGYSWLKNHQRESESVTNPAFQYVPTAGTTTYGAANANNGYTNSGATNFTYDLNRNLTFDGANTLTFDVENRLIAAQTAAAGTAQYFYDPLGGRKQKVVNGVPTQFVLAGTEEIADYTGTGPGAQMMLTVRGLHGMPVAAVIPGSGSQGETITYYHHDLMGSTVAATQPGVVGAAAFTYSEFGVPGSGEPLPYQFDGYRYDAETGLYFTGARYYSPQLGRFLQPDPIGVAGGLNTYAYTANDPLNFTDPRGLCTGCKVGKIAAIGAIGLGLLAIGAAAVEEVFTEGLATPVAAVQASAGAAEVETGLAALGLTSAAEGGAVAAGAVAETTAAGAGAAAAGATAAEGTALSAGAVSTAPGQAVLWTNIPGGAAAADAFVAQNGGATLATTLAGSGVAAPAAGTAAEAAFYEQASAMFARFASGNVTLLHSGVINAASTFMQVELPALLANTSITSLTMVDITTGARTVIALAGIL